MEILNDDLDRGNRLIYLLVICLWELSGHSDVLSDCPKEEEFLNGVQILFGRPSKNDYTESPRDRTAPTSEGATPQGNLPSWAANVAKYERDDEYGDVGPEHDELKQMLFGDEHKMEQGQDISKLTEVTVTFESVTKIEPVANFEHAGLHPVMLANVKLCGYKIPTPI